MPMGSMLRGINACSKGVHPRGFDPRGIDSRGIDPTGFHLRTIYLWRFHRRINCEIFVISRKLFAIHLSSLSC